MEPNAQNPDVAPTRDTSRIRNPQGSAASIVQDVLERAQSATGEVADKVKTATAQLPQAAQAPIQHAVRATTDAAESLSKSADRSFASITEYVKANPRRSVGIAFVTGWLIARIVF